MNDINIFSDQLEYGHSAERFFMNLVRAAYNRATVIDVTNDMSYQKLGIDCIVNGIPLDIKMREDVRWYKQDILLETISVDRTNKLGWLKTSHSRVIVYMFKDMPSFYYLYINNIRKSDILKNIEYYKLKESKNIGYSTWSRVIPVNSFDSNCLEEVEIINFKLPDNRKAFSLY